MTCYRIEIDGVLEQQCVKWGVSFQHSPDAAKNETAENFVLGATRELVSALEALSKTTSPELLK